MIKTVADVTSKVVSGGEGCIGWMTNIVVTGGERYKSESTSGGVRVKLKRHLAIIANINYFSTITSIVIDGRCCNGDLTFLWSPISLMHKLHKRKRQKWVYQTGLCSLVTNVDG